MVSLKKTDKEQRIQAAALELFIQHGVHKTTVEQIARLADVGKGTIYLFFETKEHIFASLVRKKADELLRRLRANLRKENTAKQKLRIFALTRFQYISNEIAAHGLDGDILLEIRELAEKIRGEYEFAELTLLEGILEEGELSGEIIIGDIPLTALTIAATFNALDTPWIFEGREVRLEEKIDTLIEILFTGIGATPKNSDLKT